MYLHLFLRAIVSKVSVTLSVITTVIDVLKSKLNKQPMTNQKDHVSLDK